MSLHKYESSVKTIPYTREMVFSKLSDLSNLQNVKQKLDNPELVAKLKEQADGDQVEKMIPVLKSLTSDTDSVSVSVPPEQLRRTHLPGNSRPTKFEGFVTILFVRNYTNQKTHFDLSGFP